MIRKIVTVAFALLLMSTAATGTVGAGDVASADDADVADVQDATNETADEVYRYENGSAVLVYEGEESNEDVSTARFGADVSSGLVEALVVSETGGQEDVTGQLGLQISPDTIEGDGNLSFESPENIQELDASTSGTVTDEESTAQLTLDMTAETGGGMPEADSNGEIVVGSDSFSMDADYSLDTGAGVSGMEQSRVVRIDELDNGYEVDFDEERPIHPLLREQWNTSEAAEQTVRQQYESLARQFGGSVDVTIESYDYTEAETDSERDQLDIEYTVTMNDVKDGIAETLAQQIAGSPEIDLSDEERQDLEDSLTEVTVEEIAFAQNQSGSGMDGFVDVEMTNYEAPFLATLEATASEDGPVNESQVEELRQQLAAREAADMEQTVTWSLDVAEADSTTTNVQADVNYDTTNWSAYTDELADRGMPLETDVEFEGSAQKVDDQIEVEMSFFVTQEQLVDSAIGQLADTAEESGDESAIEAIQSLENADFQVAKADIMLNRDRVEVRAAAQFDDLSQFQNSFDQIPEGVSVQQAHAEGDSDGTTTYVYVDGLDMSDEELRETELADDETTVHAPGEWDRSFPVMDVRSTGEYLGVDAEENNPPHNPVAGGGMGTDTPTVTATPTMTDTPGDDTPTATDGDTPTETADDGPGFGAVAALLALLAGALIARRDE